MLKNNNNTLSRQIRNVRISFSRQSPQSTGTEERFINGARLSSVPFQPMKTENLEISTGFPKIFPEIFRTIFISPEIDPPRLGIPFCDHAHNPLQIKSIGMPGILGAILMCGFCDRK